jgi:hypothetical protein
MQNVGSPHEENCKSARRYVHRNTDGFFIINCFTAAIACVATEPVSSPADKDGDNHTSLWLLRCTNTRKAFKIRSGYCSALAEFSRQLGIRITSSRQSHSLAY